MTEFSRIVSVEASTQEKVIEVEAGPEERAALAVRFGLLSLDHLSAKGRVHVFESGRIARLDARISADVVQSCVVTLDPVSSHIEDELSLLYARPEAAGADKSPAREIHVDLDDEEQPELLTDEGIDIGEAAAECLGLALDPYPRLANADSALNSLGDVLKGDERRSPFSALEKLKKG